MITRITLFKLRADQRAADVGARLEQALSGLSGLNELSISAPCDEASQKSWDLCLLLRFAQRQDHDRALTGTVLRPLLEQELAPCVQVIKAWSFAPLDRAG